MPCSTQQGHNDAGSQSHRTKLVKIYDLLFLHFGPQNWWPGRTRIEVIVGAILTQNTNWRNVHRAIANLKCERLLSVVGLRRVSEKTLAELIRPSGYYQVKARRLKCFLEFLDEGYEGSLARMARQSSHELRRELLSVKGIGPETADAILLYAFDKPIFVVDAYTKRVLTRHELARQEDSYQTLQDLFMTSLPEDVKLFNEFHALLVAVGKDHCRPQPRCEDCPLSSMLPYSAG